MSAPPENQRAVATPWASMPTCTPVETTFANTVDAPPTIVAVAAAPVPDVTIATPVWLIAACSMVLVGTPTMPEFVTTGALQLPPLNTLAYCLLSKPTQATTALNPLIAPEVGDDNPVTPTPGEAPLTCSVGCHRPFV